MNNNYLVQERPLKALILFSLPIIIGNLFQQFYSMVDSAVVGRYVSEQALAAIGASNSLTYVFICIAMGGGIGASVIISRHFGAKRYLETKVAVSTALLAFLAVSVLLGSFGLIFCKEIMLLLHTPIDVLDMAVEYLSIYFMGLPFLFLYNVLSSMFNALGKSRVPLYFLIFSSLLNVVLDVIMVTQWRMGVAGVAWATLLAQGVCAALSFIVLMRELHKLSPDAASCFDQRELLAMAKIALPSILQQSTISIGMMLVQSVVNRFGSETLAGFSAAMRIEAICVVPMTGIGTAMSSYTAQNIGAGKRERVVDGYHAACGAAVFFAALICLVLQCFHTPIIAMFLGAGGSAVAYATGSSQLMFMGWFYCIIGLKTAVDGLLRGAGDMTMFTVANLVNLLIRVLLAVFFALKVGVAMVWYAVPIGWFANFAISFAQYKTGKWKRIYQNPPSEA